MRRAAVTPSRSRECEDSDHASTCQSPSETTGFRAVARGRRAGPDAASPPRRLGIAVNLPVLRRGLAIPGRPHFDEVSTEARRRYADPVHADWNAGTATPGASRLSKF